MSLETLIGRAVVAQAQYTESYIARAHETDQTKAESIAIECNANYHAAKKAWMEVALQVLKDAGVELRKHQPASGGRRDECN